MIVVNGPLLVQGHGETRPVTGELFLRLVVSLGRAYPFEIVLPYGRDARARDAALAACRQGATASVSARAATPRIDHGIAAIVLQEPQTAFVDGRQIYPTGE